MPSSISSSEGPIADGGLAPRRRWSNVLVLVAAVAVLIIGAVEHHWRALDYRQNILDSAELWSIQRDRVYAVGNTPLVILGASHIEYGLDTKLLKELLPRYQPAMLARNGRYPLATLADLARDERFHGLVLCDIDARGLTGYYRDAQQDYVDYFRRQWSPSWHVHRLLLTHWQRSMLVAEPDFGATSALRRLLVSGEPPWRSPTTFHPDRSGDIDFSRADQPGLTQGFIEGYESNQRLHPVEDAGQWLAGLESIAASVAAVRRRGGDVVFVRTPTSGKLRELEDAAYPRAIYWDRLAAATGATTIHSDDVPGLQSIHLPDGSHVDMHDKPAYTRALVDALADRGLVRR
jgi:hypothetical protein